jgi:anti-sigma factor RsiW
MSWLRRRPDGHDMTCKQAVALVTAYLDGALARPDRQLFEAHLSECDMCAEHVKQIEVTIAASGRVLEEDLDPLARDDLMNLYRRWREGSASS